MGVLGWGGYLALRKETLRGRRICVIVASIFHGCGSIFTPWERQTHDFRDVVARANDTPVPLVAKIVTKH